MYYDDPVTGKREQRSTKKTNRRDAERVAAKWEAELNAGLYHRDSRMSWEQFRERFLDEYLASKPERTIAAYQTALNHFERIVNPKYLRSVDSGILSRFQAELRKEGVVVKADDEDGQDQRRNRSEAAIAAYLRHLKAAFRWAAKMEFLPKAPLVEIPGGTESRGRAITLEEFERMLAVVPKVRPNDAPAWQHYLKGLWLSGLRLEESTIVSWDDDGPFVLDLSGKFPRFRIQAAAQKGRRDELLPITPDFAEFILQTPPEARHGRLFKLVARKTGQPISASNVGRVVRKIGQRAGVVVNREAGKFAGAHDLRRSFGTRWAPKVRPPTLKKLMRHTDIKTTLTFYVSLDADDVAAELWSQHQPGVGTFVGTSAESHRAETKTPSQETTKPVAMQRVKSVSDKCPQ